MSEQPDQNNPAPAKPSVDVPGGGKPARTEQEIPKTPDRPVAPREDTDRGDSSR